MTTTITRLSTAPVYAVIPAMDLASARRFYSETLGLRLEETGPGLVLVHAGGDSKFLLYERPVREPSSATVATFVVEDLVSVVEELRSHGVVFEEYDMPGLKTVNGIAEMGEQGKGAWFKDPEGNIINLAEM